MSLFGQDERANRASRRILQSALADVAVPLDHPDRQGALKSWIRRLNGPHTEAEEAWDEVMKELGR